MVHDTPAKPAAVINVYSHSVEITGGFSPQIKNHLVEFCRKNAKMGLVRVGRRYEMRMLHLFASTTRTRDEFRVHRNQLQDLLDFLSARGVARTSLQVNYIPLYEPAKVDLRFIDPREPRKEQIPLLEYLHQQPPSGFAPSKVVNIQTGKGKGFVSIKSLGEFGVRTVIIIKPMYIAKWVAELSEMLSIDSPDDICVVRGLLPKEKMTALQGWSEWDGPGKITGSDMMIALQEQALAGELKAKIIVISNVVMAEYLDRYQEQMEVNGGYPIPPGEFYEKLGIGIRLIDEVHADFHRNYRFDLYSHIPLTISLSATLDADDPFINKRYWIVWPGATRPPDVEYDAFIDVQSLFYTIDKPQLIKCTGFAKAYSHTKFEESIMKSSRMLANYLDMITDIVDQVYVADREVGQSCIVFCATVLMCTHVQKQLAAEFPELSVKRYVSGDSYTECFLAPDIVVSTVGSAGTAVDKPNLRETVMTNALNSKQANIQVLGRTRRLKDWPDRSPRFHFLSAREIAKHVEYAQAKEVKFRGKVSSFRNINTLYRV